jgi:hypothetical protein
MTIVAYIAVISLVQFCLTLGVLVAGFAVALLLAWASTSFRTTVAGFLGGAAGVAVAVAFGYWVFQLLVGEDSYGAGVLAASTVPLVVPISNDVRRFLLVRDARAQMLDQLGHSNDAATLDRLRDVSSTAHGSAVVGEVAGLVVAIAWFLERS